MPLFYVTGLPRSRTSWLATLLSHGGDSLCLHEPLRRYKPDLGASEIASQLQLDFAGQPVRYAGIADCGLPIVAPDLPTLHPGPVLVVVRDPDEVIASLTKYLGGEAVTHAGGVALLHDRLLRFLKAHPNALRIDFELLDEMDALLMIWRHLLPDVPFPELRAKELLRMRVDPLPERLLDGVSREMAHSIRNQQSL